MVAAVETKLSVNLNKVALLRNQRDTGCPSVLDAARLVVHAGAHGITLHPRPDARHIRRSDVTEVAALIAAELPPAIELNIEGNPTPEFVALIREVRPDQVTLVPDAPDQRTSDHGWDLREPGRLMSLIRELKADLSFAAENWREILAALEERLWGGWRAAGSTSRVRPSAAC